ncbi:hypothetical protein SCHPADRAFT_559590 [Schizopora paradoxa]|uniref:DUF7770 domain-containing protein n=1 Tax=Schizopora paradoxa TaxID=27342 RepID=A0A0H2RDI6_9AGAM|nr:hypothetical protein SCHPADRAFT_559590 [Schizopora paradoxa]
MQFIFLFIPVDYARLNANGARSMWRTLNFGGRRRAIARPVYGPRYQIATRRGGQPLVPLYHTPTLRQPRFFSFYMSGCPTGQGGVHWRLFLQYSMNPAKSLRVDCKPTGSDFRTGLVTYDFVEYAYSAKSVAGMCFQLSHPMALASFGHMLVYYNLHKYQYAPGVFGCRYWCQMVLEYMIALGFIAADSKERFEGYIASMNRQQPQIFPLPIIKGSFIGGLRFVRPGDNRLFLS